jgi:hypothetical protein
MITVKSPKYLMTKTPHALFVWHESLSRGNHKHDVCDAISAVSTGHVNSNEITTNAKLTRMSGAPLTTKSRVAVCQSVAHIQV